MERIRAIRAVDPSVFSNLNEFEPTGEDLRETGKFLAAMTDQDMKVLMAKFREHYGEEPDPTPSEVDEELQQAWIDEDGEVFQEVSCLDDSESDSDESSFSHSPPTSSSLFTLTTSTTFTTSIPSLLSLSLLLLQPLPTLGIFLPLPVPLPH